MCMGAMALSWNGFLTSRFFKVVIVTAKMSISRRGAKRP